MGTMVIDSVSILQGMDESIFHFHTQTLSKNQSSKESTYDVRPHVPH